MRKALLTAAGLLVALPLGVIARRRSESPTGPPDAMSAGWAWNVQNQVAQRDRTHADYLKWVRSL